MKVRRLKVENVRSFLEPAELVLDGYIGILIGPNGGGKTNLLDTLVTVLRWFLLTSWSSRPEANEQFSRRLVFEQNNIWNANLLERHADGAGRDQIVEVEIEVTQRDIDNIRAIKADAETLSAYAEGRGYANVQLRGALNWKLDDLVTGERITFVIRNNAVVRDQVAKHQHFKEYLSYYELDGMLRQERGSGELSMPMLSLPVNRAGGSGIVASVTLAGHQDFEHKRQVDAGTSRTGGGIGPLAIGRIARKFRLLQEDSNLNARDRFRADVQIRSLTELLKSVGYDWELETADPITNRYDIRLTKAGSSFLVSRASSGEKELLTYVFGIYALNVRDAIIIIDEPELHLHPKWQATLLSLFERLAKETRNQFLMATHSPVFVAPGSVQYVSRVHSDGKQSHVTRLNNKELPEQKHLLAIVNSHNNEKIFFADKVILVEGISDKLVFNEFAKKLKLSEASVKAVEIVDVGGKHLLEEYGKLLDACKVPYAIIADLDYINEIGTEDLKKLFVVESEKRKSKVINRFESLDGQTFFARLEEAINDGNMKDLNEVWEYIKSRRLRMKASLSADEQARLNAFIEGLKMDDIYILKRRDLEAYLPVGHRNKRMDKLIRLFEDEKWWDNFDAEPRAELQEICEKAFA